MDLQQTVNENGLVDGSEVHYLINQALSNKQPKELHVPSRAEVVSSVVAEPHEDIVLTQGTYQNVVGCKVCFGSVAMSVLGRLQCQTVCGNMCWMAAPGIAVNRVSILHNMSGRRFLARRSETRFSEHLYYVSLPCVGKSNYRAFR